MIRFVAIVAVSVLVVFGPVAALEVRDTLRNPYDTDLFKGARDCYNLDTLTNASADSRRTLNVR